VRISGWSSSLSGKNFFGRGPRKRGNRRTQAQTPATRQTVDFCLGSNGCESAAVYLAFDILSAYMRWKNTLLVFPDCERCRKSMQRQIVMRRSRDVTCRVTRFSNAVETAQRCLLVGQRELQREPQSNPWQP
jgi:hypothetical protein